MLDIKFIRENQDLVAQAIRDKRMKVDLPLLLSVDDNLRKKQLEMEQFQAERNRLSKQIAQASPAEREALKAQVGDLKPQLETLEGEVRRLSEEFHKLMVLIPAPARADVPVGRDDTENVEVKRWGEVPSFDFPTKDHMALGTQLDIVDV